MMKKKTFIFLVSAAIIYLITVSLLKSKSMFMFTSISDLSFMQYELFILSQLCMAGLLAYGAYYLIKLRNHKVYKIVIPILTILIFASGGLMLFGSILKDASINSMITPPKTEETIAIGNTLFEVGLEMFILSFISTGLFIGIVEGLSENL